MDYALILQNIAKHIRLTVEEERYFISLLEAKSYKSKKLVHCIPQKQIASYIGVTPEFFSKMKKSFLRGM